jgi:hypothetical protein
MPFSKYIELCNAGGSDGSGVSGIRWTAFLTCRKVSPVSPRMTLSCEFGIMASDLWPFIPGPTPNLLSREGRGRSGSGSTLCLLFVFHGLASASPFGLTLPSLSLLRLGSKRSAELGGTESRMVGFAAAWMTRMVDAVAKRFPITSLCVISNSWSSWTFLIAIGLHKSVVSFPQETWSLAY